MADDRDGLVRTEEATCKCHRVGVPGLGELGLLDPFVGDDECHACAADLLGHGRLPSSSRRETRTPTEKVLTRTSCRS